MRKIFQNFFADRARPTLKKWVVTGTDASSGSRDLDYSWEWAATEAEAWTQALDHAAGTRFSPETIEEDK